MIRRLFVFVAVAACCFTGFAAEDAEILITDTVATPNPERFGAHVQLEIN